MSDLDAEKTVSTKPEDGGETPPPGNGARSGVADHPSESPESGPDELGRFHAFSIRNYRLLWFSSAFNGAVMWIQQTTIGWVAYDLTGSGSILGAVTGIRTIPMLLLMPFAGLSVDRFNRKHIVAASQSLLALATMLLAVAVLFDALEVWHLFAFSIVAGITNAFNMPARQTMVFDVVPRTVLPNAIALNNMAISSSRTFGPMVGGGLIALLGAASNFGLQTIFSLCVVWLSLMIVLPPRPTRTREREPMFQSMAAGYKFVLGNAHARLLVVLLLINPLFFIAMHGLLPIYAKDILETGAAGLGIMLGALGLGGVIGGLITASMARVDRRGWMQLNALIVNGVGHIVFCIIAGLTGHMWYALPFLVIAGASESLYNATNQTVLQLIAPDSMRGRVTSILQLQPLAISLGVLYAGILADVFGAEIAGLGLSVAGLICGLIVIVFSPRMRNMRLSTIKQGVA